MPENINSEIGRLLVSVTSSVGYIPIKNATVKIYAERQTDGERLLLQDLTTNESCHT